MDRSRGRQARVLRIIVAVGCVAIAFALKYTSRFASAPNWAALFGDLFLVAAMLVLVTEFIRVDLERTLAENRVDLERTLAAMSTQSQLAKEHARIGLFEVCTDCTQYDYGPTLLDSRKVIVVLNDGRTWASVHRDRLRRRFLDPLKETVVILTHPESPMLRVLARKGSVDESAIRTRILETVHLLEELKQPNTSVEILGHFLFTPHAMVIGDDSVVMTPYFLSRGGRTIPALVFKDIGGPCYFRDVVEDIERLRMDTKNISNAPSNSLCEVIPLQSRSRGSDV